MKYCFRKVNINPNNPTYSVGFSNDKPISVKTKLDLNMRFLRLVDNDNEVIMCSLDNLYVSHDIYLELNTIVKNLYPNALFLISTTHTHYAPSLANQYPMLFLDKPYYAQVLDAFNQTIKDLDLVDIDAYVSYSHIPFNKVGSTRVSANDDSNVYAGVLSIFDNDRRIGNILFYNCHPTEDDKAPDYFSSAYVGACLNKMEENHSDEFFMFMQGSDGDVSSRFTRSERSFNQTLQFGKILAECFDSLINKNINKDKLTINHNSVTYDFRFDIKDVPVIPEAFLNSLKPAEKEELLIGLEELKKFRSMENLPKFNTINLNRVNFGPYKLFFSPFELFSVYNTMVDIDKTLLIGYTNGAISYLLPPNNKTITYEYFLETICNEDKLTILEQIHNL